MTSRSAVKYMSYPKMNNSELVGNEGSLDRKVTCKGVPVK